MIPKERAHLNVTAITHEGMSGKNNEDRYGVSAHTLSEPESTPSLFAIVADGIGGHQAGEIAAEIAVETISHAVAASDASDPLAVLNEAIGQANLAIHQQSKSDLAQRGMGSTCVCVWAIGDQLYTASVGDSRIYLVRQGAIRQISTDHTWVQEAIQYGIITPDQARGHPQSHIIRRYLGSEKPVEVDFRLRLDPEETDEQVVANQGMTLLPDDLLILCSDGLSDLVEDEEIQTILEETGLEAGLQRLVDLANQRGGHDNITIVALQVPHEKDQPEEKRKGTPSKMGWFWGLLVAILALIIVVAVGFFAWGDTRPDVTQTPTPQATAPMITETSLPPTEIFTESPAAPPPTKEPPPKSTYTPWPTSTETP